QGPLAGDVYQYVGPSVGDADPNTPGNQLFDLATQQYRDGSLWKHVNVTPSAAQVQAEILDSSVSATGDLALAAHSQASINAVVIAASVGIGVGEGVGVGISGAGVYSENKIKTDVKAIIDGDGATGIAARSVSLTATDSSYINSIAGAAS